MKKFCMILPLALILCFLVGCQQQGEEGITDEEARALIDRQLEFWSGGDIEIVDEVIAPEYVISLDPHDEYEKRTLDRATYKERVLYGRLFSDNLYTYEDLIAKGDKVAVRWTYRGTTKSTRKQFVVTGMTIYHVVDGKLKGHWQNWDRLGLYKQLGYTVNPPQTPESPKEKK